jgi:hypothetical protein
VCARICVRECDSLQMPELSAMSVLRNTNFLLLINVWLTGMDTGRVFAPGSAFSHCTVPSESR